MKTNRGKEIPRTTIIINRDLWKRFRIQAMQEGKSASSLLEELIKRKLGE